MKFISGSELREILDEKNTGTCIIPDFIIEILTNLEINFTLPFTLPNNSFLSDIAEYIETTKTNTDNLTIIYRENTHQTQLIFVNIVWEKLVHSIKRAQKLKAFI